MAERALTDRLDETIDAILARGDATAALRDPELAPLARVAADLRHYPSPDFKARLRAQLQRRATMTTVLTETGIREGFTTVTPYIRVSEMGLVDFLAQVFDAEETFSGRGGGGGMHREVRIGDSMLMIGEGADAGGGVMPVRPMAFHVFVKDADVTFRHAIAAGATSLGEPADRHYGERAGFVRDPFGNHWYIATHTADPAIGHRPEGLRAITPYLHPRGAQSLIEFFRAAFDAEETFRHQSPDGVIHHAKVRIGDSMIEMREAHGEWQPLPAAIYLYVDDCDLRYEQALRAGGTSLAPPTDQPYGDRMAYVQDPGGNIWYIASRMMPRLVT